MMEDHMHIAAVFGFDLFQFGIQQPAGWALVVNVLFYSDELAGGWFSFHSLRHSCRSSRRGERNIWNSRTCHVSLPGMQYHPAHAGSQQQHGDDNNEGKKSFHIRSVHRMIDAKCIFSGKEPSNSDLIISAPDPAAHRAE